MNNFKTAAERILQQNEAMKTGGQKRNPETIKVLANAKEALITAAKNNKLEIQEMYTEYEKGFVFFDASGISRQQVFELGKDFLYQLARLKKYKQTSLF